MYTWLVFGMEDMTAIRILVTRENATKFITDFYTDKLPQFLHGQDLNGMEWTLKAEKVQCVSTSPYVADPNAQVAVPPGTAPVWKPNFNSGRN